MKHTRSNRAAARYLNCSYYHYRGYAKVYKDEETGLSLFELHKNQGGKEIPKQLLSKGKEPPLLDLIEGRVPIEHFDTKKVKERILAGGLLEESCSRCGYHERRMVDMKMPLILHHKDGNKKNYHLENLEFLCYNCSFLYASSPISEQQVEAMEDYVLQKDKNLTDWELDEHHIAHLKELGLLEDKKDWSEYISRL